MNKIKGGTMDSKSFSEGLQARMKEVLDAATDDRTSLMMTMVTLRSLLVELKRFVLTYRFRDESEEVSFFKKIKPLLLSEYLYYKKRIAIQQDDSFLSMEERVKNYQKILRKLQRYTRKNQDFYAYCITGATEEDTQYFIRKESRRLSPGADENFTTGYDVKLAKLLAYERVRLVVVDALRKTKEHQQTLGANPLQWTNQKVALVELIYALHAAGVFNYGRADVKQIVCRFEEMFSIDLGNYARVFAEIRIRKSGQSNFLDQAKEKYLQLVNSMY